MGEGFVVMQSNDVDIYYYQDEPGGLMHARIPSDAVFIKADDGVLPQFDMCICSGLVPAEQESSEEAETSSEDDKLQDLPPCWGLDIVCGKGTDFNYGPWADRQRWAENKHNKVNKAKKQTDFCVQTLIGWTAQVY